MPPPKRSSGRRRRPTRAAAHRKVVRDARPIYEALLEFQGGGCAICGKPPNPVRRHATDHDHKTMQLRGILCTACNMRLTTRVTEEWLVAAAAYLADPPARRYLELQGM